MDIKVSMVLPKSYAELKQPPYKQTVVVLLQ